MASPRWKTVVEKAIAEYKNQTGMPSSWVQKSHAHHVDLVFQVATLEASSASGGPKVPIPRVRSQVFRSFLTSPKLPSLPLLLSSTDIRTPKVAQLTSSTKAEVVWWIEGTKQQLRFSADVYIVPHISHPVYTIFREAVIKAGRGTGLSAFKADTDDEWEKRRIDLFHTMSPHMKASWCRPVPGSKLEGDAEEEAKRWPERIVEPDEGSMGREEYEKAKKDWEMALGNFALVIVDPVEVDFVDLSSPPDRRSLFTKKVQSEEDDRVIWEEVNLVP